MGGAFGRITAFLFQDVQSEKETKDLAVLIRIICCIFVLYFLVIGITVASIGHYLTGLLLVGGIGLTVGAFILTYENRTVLGMVLLNILLLFFPTMLTLLLGFSQGFYLPVFLNILLIYFNKTNRMVLKRVYSISLMIYLMCLAEISNAVNLTVVPSATLSMWFQTFNMLMFSCAILASAWSYCQKFNQAEEKLRRINENLERMANLDTLTKLSNRRHMNEHLAGLVFDYNRSNKAFTMAIGDIDFFKKVNDTYGHDTGDYVLSTVADIFRKYMKDKGHVARWGGEEFLFSFENMDLEKAYRYLDELRHLIESTPMDFKEYHFNITMTYGIEEFNPRLGIEATINRADAKLYKGKQGGRNRVVK
ncbi:MAG: GGDEF domain-containing protein [Lachnospiraceae bacterium]|nr:GGDEF domain-containing protein [Lachnospiraceae bacterium]